MEINDILWLESIVEKLAWKHQVLPNEVDICSQYDKSGEESLWPKIKKI